MDPFTVAIVLIVLGALLLIAEAFSPGVFLVIPGVVLVIVGLIGIAIPDVLFTWWTPVIAMVVAIPVTTVTLLGYRRLGSPEPPTTTVAESLVGREGVVTVAIEPGNIRGKVRIGSDTWSATSDEAIPEGESVTVMHSEGVHVRVCRSGGDNQ